MIVGIEKTCMKGSAHKHSLLCELQVQSYFASILSGWLNGGCILLASCVMLCHYSALLVLIASKFNIKDFDQFWEVFLCSLLAMGTKFWSLLSLYCCKCAH